MAKSIKLTWLARMSKAMGVQVTNPTHLDTVKNEKGHFAVQAFSYVGYESGKPTRYYRIAIGTEIVYGLKSRSLKGVKQLWLDSCSKYGSIGTANKLKGITATHSRPDYSIKVG